MQRTPLELLRAGFCLLTALIDGNRSVKSLPLRE
jgi:hypothetical protein